MRLILIRHGATAWSATGQHTGHSDIPLSDEGLRQAASLRKPLSRLLAGTEEPIAAYSSPLERSQDTSRLATEGQIPVTSSDELMEMDYGDYEGLTPSEIRAANPGWDIWKDGCPGGEDVCQVATRVGNFLATLDGDATSLVFAHGHLLRILAAVHLGLGPAEGQIFTLDPATLSVLDDVRGKRVIALWNFDSTADYARN